MAALLLQQRSNRKLRDGKCGSTSGDVLGEVD